MGVWTFGMGVYAIWGSRLSQSEELDVWDVRGEVRATPRHVVVPL